MNCDELIPNRKYILKNKNEIIEGIFVTTMKDSGYVLMKCMSKRSLPGIYYYGFCKTDDIYYDWDEIRNNARKARESFEHRALNKILKRLINEEFQW